MKKNILELRPTQFVLGLKEIESKIQYIRAMDSKELKAYCDDHVIPVILGPKGQTYMIDHHHFARACWETETEIFSIKVVKDLSKLSESAFWNEMVSRGWTYLHDQFGLGPHSPHALPGDVRGMADDPYRSLAWALRELGYIKKNDTPFFEFQWAAYFRLNLETRLYSKSDFKDAIKQAKKLAHAKPAKVIPGYTGPR